MPELRLLAMQLRLRPIANTTDRNRFYQTPNVGSAFIKYDERRASMVPLSLHCPSAVRVPTPNEAEIEAP